MCIPYSAKLELLFKLTKLQCSRTPLGTQLHVCAASREILKKPVHEVFKPRDSQSNTAQYMYMYLMFCCYLHVYASSICHLHVAVPTLHFTQRRPSLLGTSRPVTLTVRRSSSLRKGSGEDDRRTYLRSRNSATRLSQCLDRQRSHSLDQLLYDNSKSHQC